MKNLVAVLFILFQLISFVTFSQNGNDTIVNAQKLIDGNRLQEARSMLDHYILSNTQSSVANNLLGIIYLRQDNPLDARKYFNAALDLNKKYSDAYYNRGLSYVESKEYKKAISDFTRAIKYDPEDGESYYERGLIWYDKNKYRKALNNFSVAVKYVDSSKYICECIHKYMGDTYYELKMYNLAIQSYTVSLTNDQNDTSAIYGRAMAKNQAKDYMGALSDYDRLIEMTNTDAEIFFRRGFLKAYHLHKRKSAIDDYSKAIMLDHNFSKVYYFRGFAKYRESDLDGACQDWTKAKELGFKGNIKRLLRKYCN